ncbi:MAG: glycosyltransferase family 4 protein [bacterium]|nr:glycosyltransferase family 4 protein [bacterium]
MSKELRILALGPLPPPLGGARVLFKDICDELAKRDDVRLKIIETWNRLDSLPKRALSALVALCRLLREMRRFDVVVFFASSGATVEFGPVVGCVCRAFNRPWIQRAFGGDLDIVYQRLGRVGRRSLKRSLRSAALCLFETKYLVEFFSRECNSDRIKRHPNARKLSSESIAPAERSNRFVFLGHVKVSKGIKVLIEAFGRLDETIAIDVYGALEEGLDERCFDGVGNVEYKGLLPQDQVPGVLKSHRALVFPTFYKGEGYPGVIIEAYNAGIPVITTKWRGIPEIVDESCGILIEPSSANELVGAISRLASDDELHGRLCAGAREKAKEFSLEHWVDVLVGYCRKVGGIDDR